MKIGDWPALCREFYYRETVDVARSLLNCVLIRETAEGVTAGRITETEAYTHEDPSSHSFRGKTERNASMFGPAGRAYVYFTYGMHFCFNVVTGPEGIADAALIRAVEPIEGWELMSRRRGLAEEEIARLLDAARPYGTGDAKARQRWAFALCGGPGKLCSAFGISRAEDGTDLTTRNKGADGLWIGAPLPDFGAARPDEILASRRIGIRQAVEAPWRFTLQNDPYVSRK